MVSMRLKQLATAPWSHERVVNCYSGGKRAMYLNAMESLKERPVDSRDARIKAFVKGDKARLDAKFKYPRLIQARSVRYNLELARWVKPLEHALYGLTAFKDQRVPVSRIVAKGLSLTARATVIKEKFDAIPDCVVVSIDCSQFDRHVSPEVLRLEHLVYKQVYNDPMLQRLLSWQLRNKGTTSCGVKYTVNGNRASGDMNTALGNCLIMILIVRMIGHAEQWNQYDMFVDGDDTLLFVPASNLDNVKRSVPHWFKECGFDVRVEGVYKQYQDIEHCQGKPVFNGREWIMARNPYKVISHLGSSYKHFRHQGHAQRMLLTMAKCEMLLTRGLPVASVYARNLCDALSNYKPAELSNRDDEFYRVSLEPFDWRNFAPWDVTEQSRRSFERAWGISVPDQLALERALTIKGPITVPTTPAEQVLFSAGGLLWYEVSDRAQDNLRL